MHRATCGPRPCAPTEEPCGRSISNSAWGVLRSTPGYSGVLRGTQGYSGVLRGHSAPSKAPRGHRCRTGVCNVAAAWHAALRRARRRDASLSSTGMPAAAQALRDMAAEVGRLCSEVPAQIGAFAAAHMQVRPPPACVRACVRVRIGCTAAARPRAAPARYMPRSIDVRSGGCARRSVCSRRTQRKRRSRMRGARRR